MYTAKPHLLLPLLLDDDLPTVLTSAHESTLSSYPKPLLSFIDSRYPTVVEVLQ
jgi:hypothetical protein